MARTRSLKSRAVRQTAPRPQCAGITRRGARCRCKVAVPASSQPATAPFPSIYCKTHLRMSLNSQAAPRVLQPGARQRYRGQ